MGHREGCCQMIIKPEGEAEAVISVHLCNHSELLGHGCKHATCIPPCFVCLDAIHETQDKALPERLRRC